MMKLKVLLAIAVSVTMLNCRGYHYFMDMYISPAVDTQEEDIIGGRKGNMIPPEGSVAYGQKGYYLTNAIADYARADCELVSPVKQADKRVASRGKLKYGIYCSPCHGMTGQGDGPIKAKWPAIPALVSQPGKPSPFEKYGAGRIYHVITVGKGAMFSYSSQLPDFDRWLVAQYVKQLQKK